MSAYTVAVLDGLRERVMAVDLTAAQFRFRLFEYVDTRGKTPLLLVWVHDVSGLWRGFSVAQLRWLHRHIAVANEEARRG